MIIFNDCGTQMFFILLVALNNRLHAQAVEFVNSPTHVPCHYPPCYVTRCLGVKRSGLTSRELVTKDSSIIINYSEPLVAGGTV